MKGLSAIADRYDLVLSDVWEVLHDGVTVHQSARDALNRFRRTGGSVILLSNASRLTSAVAPELEQLGVASTDYDALISSGDIAHVFLSQRPGAAVFDVGPASARTLCARLDLRFTTVDAADIAITAGAFQDSSDLDQLRPVLRAMLKARLLLVCANPDVVTEIGGKRVLCAGAVAQAYIEMGGNVHFTGKPHSDIFDRAMSVAAELRGAVTPRERILVVGDSLSTDVAGANRNGFDSLFVMSGIHQQDLGKPDSMRPAALDQMFEKAGIAPTAVTWRLVW